WQWRVDDWPAYLESQSKKTGVSKDAASQWMLARAQTAEFAGRTQLMRPLEGRSWIDRALATATSDVQRFACVKYLTKRLELAREFSQASTLLSSTKGQFSDSSIINAVSQLQTEVDFANQTDLAQQQAAST